jgi:hypothetical protein
MEQLNFFEKLEDNINKCIICNKHIIKKRKIHMCCSKSCSNKYHHIKNSKKKSEKNKIRWQEDKQNSDFMERKKINYKRWYTKNGKDYYDKNKKKDKVEDICPTCNNVFQKLGSKIYCSKDCRIKIYKSSDTKRKTKECSNCKKLYSIDNFALCDKYGSRRGKCKNCHRENLQKTKGTLQNYKKEKSYIEELHMLQNQGKRRCRLCDIVKPLDDFHTSNSKKVYYNKKTYCKKCARNVYARPYLQSETGKQKKSKWDKKYASKPETAEKRNKKHMERYYTDVEYKLLCTLRGRMKAAFKSKKLLKENKTIELLGCKVKEAREHIEKQFKEGMTWENHGINCWHIDHILPCASFDLTDPEQQKKCFHYTNLQPLWAKENISKGAKIL